MGTLAEALACLGLVCEHSKISLSLEFQTGKSVAFDPMNPGAPPKPENVRQGPSGWTITLGGYSPVDPSGEEKVFPDLADAISWGMEMVKTVLNERNGATGAA